MEIHAPGRAPLTLKEALVISTVRNSLAAARERFNHAITIAVD
jgi:hypothetical protein